MAGTGYDDDGEFTPEELAALENDNTPPVPEGAVIGSTEEPAAADPAAAPAPAPAATPAAAPEPGAPPPAAAPAPAMEGDELAAFLEANRGKSPEELATALYQQTKRASSAGFQARRTAQQLEAITARAQEAQRRAASMPEAIAADRRQFQEMLADDPDKAAAWLFDRMAAQTAGQVDDAADEAALVAAVEMAETAIPGFGQIAPRVQAFARELNFTDDELAGIRDGRQLVTLHLASIAGNMLRGGLIDIYGRIRQMPPPVQTSDPRLTPPGGAPATLGAIPAAAPGTGATIHDQLANISNMSDEDFDKLDPKVIEALLAKA